MGELIGARRSHTHGGPIWGPTWAVAGDGRQHPGLGCVPTRCLAVWRLPESFSRFPSWIRDRGQGGPKAPVIWPQSCTGYCRWMWVLKLFPSEQGQGGRRRAPWTNCGYTGTYSWTLHPYLCKPPSSGRDHTGPNRDQGVGALDLVTIHNRLLDLLKKLRGWLGGSDG